METSFCAIACMVRVGKKLEIFVQTAEKKKQMEVVGSYVLKLFLK